MKRWKRKFKENLISEMNPNWDDLYKKFYKEVFAKIDSSKSENLIIDLRDNLGGRLDEIAYLYTYLVSEEHQFIEKAQTAMTKLLKV